MIQPTRRGFLTALLLAPVIVKASSLMAVKPPPPIEGRFDTSPEDGINAVNDHMFRVDIYGHDHLGLPTRKTYWVEKEKYFAAARARFAT